MWENNKILIITCIYNNIELVRETIESVKKNTLGEFEHVLVYNHPPYPEVKEYIYNSGCTIVDPMENIGCHRGFNFAFSSCKGDGFDFVVKLDDDTIVPYGWNGPMMEVLEIDDNLAYVASINQNAKQGSDFVERVVGKYTIEIPKSGCVGFSCVMFPMWTLEKIGILSKMRTLYGGEELDFLERVRGHGKYGAYIKDVTAFHLGNETRDDDYVLWKYVYGYQGYTNKDLIEFKKDRQALIKGYTAWLQDENVMLQKIAKKRLGEIYDGE